MSDAISRTAEEYIADAAQAVATIHNGFMIQRTNVQGDEDVVEEEESNPYKELMELCLALDAIEGMQDMEIRRNCWEAIANALQMEIAEDTEIEDIRTMLLERMAEECRNFFERKVAEAVNEGTNPNIWGLEGLKTAAVLREYPEFFQGECRELILNQVGSLSVDAEDFDPSQVPLTLVPGRAG